MAITFNSKGISIQYQAWTSYKLFQLIVILKIYGKSTLNEINLIIYILDNNINLEKVKNMDISIPSLYFTNKIVDFALFKNIIEFKRLRLGLTLKGEEFYNSCMKKDVFTEMVKEVINVKKQKEEIKKLLKHKEK